MYEKKNINYLENSEELTRKVLGNFYDIAHSFAYLDTGFDCYENSSKNWGLEFEGRPIINYFALNFFESYAKFFSPNISKNNYVDMQKCRMRYSLLDNKYTKKCQDMMVQILLQLKIMGLTYFRPDNLNIDEIKQYPNYETTKRVWQEQGFN